MGIYILAIAVTVVFAYFWQRSLNPEFTANGFRIPGGSQLKIRYARVFCVLSFLPLFCVNALMYYVGPDYGGYVSLFEQIRQGGGEHLDAAYLLINKFVLACGLPFQFVYIIVCAIGYIVLYKCVRDYSACFALSLLLYFVFVYYFDFGMNALRQFGAIMLVFYSMRFIISDKLIPYVITVLLATAFHFTAIVMLPFYFILKVRFKASYYMILIACMLPLNLFYDRIIHFLFKTFRPAYEQTAYVTKGVSIDVFGIVGMLIVLFLIFIYYDAIVQSGKKNVVFMNAAILAFILMTFCTWVPLVHRFVFYFYLPAICLIPNILQMERKLPLRYLFTGVVVAYYAVFILRPQIHLWLPYDSIF